jgi:hypothetical protein
LFLCSCGNDVSNTNHVAIDISSIVEVVNTSIASRAGAGGLMIGKGFNQPKAFQKGLKILIIGLIIVTGPWPGKIPL